VKYVLVIILGVLALCAIAQHDLDKPKAPQTAQQKADTAYLAAIGGCKNWTETHSKMAVGKFTDEYEVTGVKVLPGHYLVGVEYRTQGIGLLARSKCEYTEHGGQMVLVQAKAALVK